MDGPDVMNECRQIALNLNPTV